MKSCYIAEKPSVAKAFAAALGTRFTAKDGYMEGDDAVVTWCVGHLVTMCYPDAYDAKYKRWSMETIPFIPEDYKYEVIASVQKQFRIVSSLLNREDVDTIYICTDAGREGEYIYRLVEMMSGVKGKKRKRVWIDSQTEEEIHRGIREAKDAAEYDNLSESAFLRAKEDYLMGINFSRVLTLRYAYSIKKYLNIDKCVISVGRVMTCVLGMIVEREREIRDFKKTPFYRVEGKFSFSTDDGDAFMNASWRVSETSAFNGSPLLYNEKGFKTKEGAKGLIASCGELPASATVLKVEKKSEKKNPPLLYNLAELQNDCARFFKISPDETLAAAQTLYEQKLTTYPRTDARVLSSAVAKEIEKNLKGLLDYEPCAINVKAILQHGTYKTIGKTRYVNDKQVTDHYAIIPTGQGLKSLSKLPEVTRKVYECIVRRFLAVFYPAAKYEKVGVTVGVPSTGSGTEEFYASYRVLVAKGYLHVMEYTFKDKAGEVRKEEDGEDNTADEAFLEKLKGIKKGSRVELSDLAIKESETTPPKRYNSGSLILAMENAGQFIEDEELRAQIKGSGIGTSATRAEILKKLVTIKYLKLNKKTQIITPTQMGEMVYEAVYVSMKPMLNPALTASWEKGLAGVCDGSVTKEEYTGKLNDFVRRRTEYVKNRDDRDYLMGRFDAVARAYPVRRGTPQSPAVTAHLKRGAKGIRKGD